MEPSAITAVRFSQVSPCPRSETAAIGYTDAAAEAGKTVIAIGKNEADQPYVSTEEFAKAVAGFKYDAAGYEFKVSKSGDTATLEKTADTPEPPVEEPFKVTQVGQVTSANAPVTLTAGSDVSASSTNRLAAAPSLFLFSVTWIPPCTHTVVVL